MFINEDQMKSLKEDSRQLKTSVDLLLQVENCFCTNRALSKDQTDCLARVAKLVLLRQPPPEEPGFFEKVLLYLYKIVDAVVQVCDNELLKLKKESTASHVLRFYQNQEYDKTIVGAFFRVQHYTLCLLRGCPPYKFSLHAN